jgi:molybdopterin-binding protein
MCWRAPIWWPWGGASAHPLAGDFPLCPASHIEPGAVNAEVTIELAPNLTVVSIITLDAVKSLQMKVGGRAYAVIKASSVMVAVD